MQRTTMASEVISDTTISRLARMIISSARQGPTGRLVPTRTAELPSPAGIARRASVVGDRWHHQHDLHPPGGLENVTRERSPSVA